MEGINLIPEEKKPFPRHIKEPLVRGFWITIIVAIFIGTFSVSIMFFSTVSRGWNKVTPRSALEPMEQRKVWVGKSLTECAEDWDRKNIDLEKYLDSLGVKVFDKVQTKDPNFKEAGSCRNCSCLSGDFLYLNIYEEFLEDLPGFNETLPPIER